MSKSISTDGNPYSIPQAAKRLGIPASTMYDRARAGHDKHLHPIKVGASTRYPYAVVERMRAGEVA